MVKDLQNQEEVISFKCSELSGIRGPITQEKQIKVQHLPHFPHSPHGQVTSL